MTRIRLFIVSMALLAPMVIPTVAEAGHNW
jgi:hypothetical protein